MGGSIIGNAVQVFVRMVFIVNLCIVGDLGDIRHGGLGTLVDGGVVFQLVGIGRGGHNIAGPAKAIHTHIHRYGCLQLIRCFGGDSHVIIHPRITGGVIAGHAVLGAVRVNAVLHVYVEIGAHIGLGVGGSVHILAHGGGILGAVVVGVRPGIVLMAVSQQHIMHLSVSTGAGNVHPVVGVVCVIGAVVDAAGGDGNPLAGAVIPVCIHHGAGGRVYLVEGLTADRGHSLGGLHGGVGVSRHNRVRLCRVLGGIDRGSGAEGNSQRHNTGDCLQNCIAFHTRYSFMVFLFGV